MSLENEANCLSSEAPIGAKEEATRPNVPTFGTGGRPEAHASYSLRMGRGIHEMEEWEIAKGREIARMNPLFLFNP